MKKSWKFIIQLFMICLVSTFVYASDQEEFITNYTNKSIQIAVEKSLEEGVYPEVIIKWGLNIEELNPQNLVMALYCAGVRSKYIRDASVLNNVSEVIIVAGYKKSIAECSKMVAESYTYTPVSKGSSSGGSVSVSPSTF